MHRSHEEFRLLCDQGRSPADVIESLRQNSEMKEAADQFMGFGLFRIDDLLPKKMLADFSWRTGECLSFLDGSEQGGWPTKIWPISQKPFLCVNDLYYCFDAHSLFDNIYRVVQREVLTQEPAYRNTWNEAQKIVSETMPLDLLRVILPGASAFPTVYYRTRELDALGKRNWSELDGVVAFEDHLL